MDSLKSIGRETEDSLQQVDNPPDNGWDELAKMTWTKPQKSTKISQQAYKECDKEITKLESLLANLDKKINTTSHSSSTLSDTNQTPQPLPKQWQDLQGETSIEKITLAEIYHATENPLTDKLIDGAIEARINAAKHNQVVPDSGAMYGLLTVDKAKTETEPNIADKAKFHEKLFHNWRDNLAKITPDEYQAMLQTKTVGSDFAQMRKFVLAFPDAKYPGQLKQLAEQNYREDLAKSINQYCYDYVSKDGWEYITSHRLNGCKKRDINDNHIGHRLYLNVPNDKLYQIASQIVEEFQEKRLPFEFKFDDTNKTRRDSIVFYCETEQLANNVQVLRELKERNPELFGTIDEPPIATGKIDGWIGYGSEPEDTGKESFNTIRAKALWKGITNTAIDWVDNNKDIENKSGTSIKEIIVNQAIVDKKASLHSNSKIHNPEKLQADILKNFDKALKSIREDSANIQSKPLSNEKIGAIWKVQHQDLANTIATFIPYIKKVNPLFHEQCKHNIMKACTKFGIHKQNFAYDEWALQEMVTLYQSQIHNK